MKTVVKIGGSLLSSISLDNFVSDLERSMEGPFILVHGGGPEVTELCKRLGIEPKFVVSPSGIRSRLTDSETISAYVMAMKGKINTEIVLAMQRRGMNGFGLSGIDGPTIVAERKKRLLTINERGRKMFIDGGYTGRIISVETKLVNSIMDNGYIPVISPIAASIEHEPLNIDGDRAASAVSGALAADSLILLTNVDGVLVDDEIVANIRLEEIPGYMKKVGYGMDKKLLAAREAIEAGTSEVIISNGLLEDPIGHAINSSQRTVIRK